MSSGSLKVLDEFQLNSPKTKEMKNLLTDLGVFGKKVTILVEKLDENIRLSARNLKNILIIKAVDASAYDLLDCEFILFDKNGLLALNNQLLG